jgi:hypothetical protein
LLVMQVAGAVANAGRLDEPQDALRCEGNA